MKLIYVIVFLMISSMAFAKINDYNELVKDLKKPDVEVLVNQLMGGFKKESVVDIIGGETYNIARSGVGCAAGFFGGADTAFTIIDIVSQDPTDFQSYIFAVIFSIAWWQQNGQYLEYMCTNFWRLIHN